MRKLLVDGTVVRVSEKWMQNDASKYYIEYLRDLALGLLKHRPGPTGEYTPNTEYATAYSIKIKPLEEKQNSG